jgi:flagellar FliJ protein
LEKVLGLKKFNEDEVLVELGKVRSQLTKAQEQKKLLEKEEREAGQSMIGSVGEMSCMDIIDYDNYRRGLRRQIANQDLIILEIKNQERRVIEKYMEARKERLVLERLKEKKLAEHKDRMIKEEKKIIAQIDMNKITHRMDQYENADV